MQSLLKCTFLFDAFVDAIWTFISEAALIKSGLFCCAVKFTLTVIRSQFAVTQMFVLLKLLYLVPFRVQCYILYRCRLIELKSFYLTMPPTSVSICRTNKTQLATQSSLVVVAILSRQQLI